MVTIHQWCAIIGCFIAKLPTCAKMGSECMGDATAIRKWYDSNALKYKVSHLLLLVS